METVILAEGKVDAETGDPKILVDVIKPMRESDIKPVVVPDASGVAEETPDVDPQAGGTWQGDIETNFYVEQDNGYEEPPPSPEEMDWHLAPPQKATSNPQTAPQVEPASDMESSTKIDTPPSNAKTVTVPEPIIEPTPPTDFIKPPVIFPPSGVNSHAGEKNQVHMVTVTLKSSGARDRDVRRIKMVHGLLNSFPGRDRFCFMVYENGYRHLLDFPNDTTSASTDLLSQLSELVGRDNIQVELI